ncbi:MAG: hypothetical protein EXQ74_05010 [Thermoleophilia bacterium]|nr:hypothetical protein [Thermoleophilia bacterium]
MNGWPSSAPITVDQLVGYLVATVPVPRSITMFTSAFPLMPGTVMGSIPPGSIDLNFTANAPTATVSFDINSGFSTD